ncbi:hypothetical protein EVAR_67585_1 [Eumeta japonica]|uniref:Uncharacterized protein n=1 Tax=Eumeta variegata TaxID=151549 RepID=A0A4C2A533_EUMVA|nr:hypothetical protein EVAR_67585_1 [Eumeta japonica]
MQSQMRHGIKVVFHCGTQSVEKIIEIEIVNGIPIADNLIVLRGGANERLRTAGRRASTDYSISSKALSGQTQRQRPARARLLAYPPAPGRPGPRPAPTRPLAGETCPLKPLSSRNTIYMSRGAPQCRAPRPSARHRTPNRIGRRWRSNKACTLTYLRRRCALGGSPPISCSARRPDSRPRRRPGVRHRRGESLPGDD